MGATVGRHHASIDGRIHCGGCRVEANVEGMISGAGGTGLTATTGKVPAGDAEGW